MLIKGLQPVGLQAFYIEERVLIYSALFFCMKMASLSQLLHFCHSFSISVTEKYFVILFHTF